MYGLAFDGLAVEENIFLRVALGQRQKIFYGEQVILFLFFLQALCTLLFRRIGRDNKFVNRLIRVIRDNIHDQRRQKQRRHNAKHDKHDGRRLDEEGCGIQQKGQKQEGEKDLEMSCKSLDDEHQGVFDDIRKADLHRHRHHGCRKVHQQEDDRRNEHNDEINQHRSAADFTVDGDHVEHSHRQRIEHDRIDQKKHPVIPNAAEKVLDRAEISVGSQFSADVEQSSEKRRHQRYDEKDQKPIDGAHQIGKQHDPCNEYR